MINSNKTARIFIKDICEKHDVKSELILVGFGRTYSSSKKRYEYKTGFGLIENKKAKYVAKYIQEGDFFLIWKIKEPKSRTDFSAAYDQVQEALDRSKELTKSIEYSGWGTENVMVLSKSDVESFIISLKATK